MEKRGLFTVKVKSFEIPSESILGVLCRKTLAYGVVWSVVSAYGNCTGFQEENGWSCIQNKDGMSERYVKKLTFIKRHEISGPQDVSNSLDSVNKCH